MYPSVFRKEDKIIMLRPAVFTCGCGSITARLGSVLNFAGLSSRTVDQVRPQALKIAKEWLAQEGMYDKCPLLKQHVYGVLITPSGEWLDINQGAANIVGEKFAKMYKEAL